MSGRVRYRFGEFELNAECYELARSGERVAVRPKVFDILLYLLEHAEGLVTKEELLDALWAGQQVNETSVPWTISQARRVIGQRSSDKTPIETVHGRGYRWRGPVEKQRGELRVPDAVRCARPFVGREALMAALGERLLDAKEGRGGLCVLVGDAGIGKTRCIDELAAVARAQGFAIWSGRSAQDTLAPVYFPWIQLLRSVTGDEHTQRTLPDLLARLSAGDDRKACVNGRDAVLGRLSLFETVRRFLIESARRMPLLLVIDDLHWADAGTVELLGFVAPELRNARVLVLAAQRGPLATSTTRCSAEPMRYAERFDLEPLSVDSVVEYVRAVNAGRATELSLCEAVHRVSAGYPLFVQETLRGLLAQYGREALSSLPAESVQPSAHARDVLCARLSALALSTRQALACASVLGDGFEVTSLLRLTGVALDALLEALDGALQSGFVVAEGVHRFRFRHALFREVVYEQQMTTADRMHYHHAAALMRQSSADAAQRKSEIAHHHYRSLALGYHAQVRAAALDAAQAARSAHSFGDAAQFCAWALEALALDSAATPREYAELLLQHAQAQLYGQTHESRATVKQLVKVAAEHGFGDLLVQASRVLRLSLAVGTVPDRLARFALERALEFLPESAKELRVQALSMLAWLPPDAHDMQRSKALSQRALDLARCLGSREALAEALNARLYALSGPDDIDALLAASDEMLALDREPRGWISVEAFTARQRALLHRGDIAGADAAVAAIGEVASTRGFLELRWHHDRFCAQRRFLSGDFAAAEAEFLRLDGEVARMQVRSGAVIARQQRALLTIITRGPRAFAAAEEPEFFESFRNLLRPTSTHASSHANLSRLALACDKRDLARQVLDELSADDFAVVPKDIAYLHTLCNLAVTAIGLADRDCAERLYALLEPYASHNTPNGLGLYEGPVAHFLALLAAFLVRNERAGRYFAQAIEINERLGLRPLLARSYFECARWSLRAHCNVRADALRMRAIELSDELGLQWLGQQARSLAPA